MSKRSAVGTQHIPVSVARQGKLSSHACAKPGAMRARGRVRTSDGRQVVHDNFFHDDSHDDVHDCMRSTAAPPRSPCSGVVPGWLESAHNPCGFAQCAFRPKSPSWKDLTSASMLWMARKSNRILRFPSPSCHTCWRCPDPCGITAASSEILMLRVGVSRLEDAVELHAEHCHMAVPSERLCSP